MTFSHIFRGFFMVALLASPLLADISDSFDNATLGKNGWTETGDPDSTLTYFSTGGNPGGYVELHDAGEGADDYFVAPSTYLGSKSQYLGGTLSFDLRTEYNGTPDSDIVLSNGTTTLAYLFPTQPSGGAWTHYSIPISTSDPHWHLGSYTGAAPALSDFKAVLASLTNVEILGDYISGTENNDLDNVVLHANAHVGDANLDGRVDLSDLNIVLNDLGNTTSAWTSGNFDGAATIDLTDLNDVLNNLGYSGVAPSIPTPEPASLSLFVFAAAVFFARHK